MKILLIDNYDSFTFNLYHSLSSLNTKVDVFRNDEINEKEIIKRKYNKIVISPGPGNPNQSGNCIRIVKNLYKKIPILGVCLGHQIIGQVFGSKIIQRVGDVGTHGKPDLTDLVKQSIQYSDVCIFPSQWALDYVNASDNSIVIPNGPLSDFYEFFKLQKGAILFFPLELGL